MRPPKQHSNQYKSTLLGRDLKSLVDASYLKQRPQTVAGGFVVDPKLSDRRVQVYTHPESSKAFVVHRGSASTLDWVDNIMEARFGLPHTWSSTYKKHKKRHQKAVDTYGADNVVSIGHSRAGRYVETLNEAQPVSQVITYNKWTGNGLGSSIGKKVASNQTDIRTNKDPVSFLSLFQRKKKRQATTLKAPSFFKSHGTSALDNVSNTPLVQLSSES